MLCRIFAEASIKIQNQSITLTIKVAKTKVESSLGLPMIHLYIDCSYFRFKVKRTIKRTGKSRKSRKEIRQIMGSKPSSQRGIIIVPDTSDNEHNQPGEIIEESGNANDAIILERPDYKLDPDFRDPLLVIAIDFGTTYSGYAFAFKGYKGKIFTANHGFTQEDDRVPTIVLLNPDKTFNSFGYEAQETYSKLNEEKVNYFYFEHFKIALSKTTDQSNKAEIRDSNGRPVDAKHIFVMLIENLLELAMDIAKGLRKGDISWIITIPATWSDLAKRTIRESVLSAGIEKRNLRFVLEPYAAALYCMQMNLSTGIGISSEYEPTSAEDQFVESNKYIIADIGGGTSDVWVFEVLGERELKELHRATEEIGGHSVNSEFSDLIATLVGETVWSKFVNNHTASYQDFMRNFERKKKSFSSEKEAVTMSVENALLDVLANTTGETFQEVVEKIGANDKVLFKPQFNKLTLDKETMEELFEPSLNGILRLLEETLDTCQEWSVHTLFLVGGYSESPYLREKIISKFSHVRVVFHEDAKLAVLKGAVMMGYKADTAANFS
ncbi:heat shock 70 kDa protein 12A-like [Mercenaria mercenaria]|uniref:heat shock 70 kDa protein 12A-like n=1 Tax=Mercenaria mercenaria TaxID=6596 RepID=UPI00234F59FC|nr:heat shock 70 kDa protein 12A-like [Mercenaria mercenaria]